jgi:8-oxo-dGTP pyrophosphatase MutT (NUDIX family)
LREAARAVVFDADGAVALLHVGRDGYYKLPGGGIDRGESPKEALERELMEEIGCKAEVTHELGSLLEQRYYWNMTQRSYCYAARQIGKKGEPDFTDSERERGFEIVWAKNIDEAISLLEKSEPSDTSEELAHNITFMRLRDVAIAKRAKEMR